MDLDDHPSTSQRSPRTDDDQSSLPKGAQASNERAELYFLIAHTLSNGPLANVGRVLVEEASAKGLLPTRIDYLGHRHQVSYAALQSKYAHLPPDALLQALQDLLEYRKKSITAPSGAVVSSFLDPSVIPGPTDSVFTQPLLAANSPRPPFWTLPPYSIRNVGKGLSAPRLALLRETGPAAAYSTALGGQILFSSQAYSQQVHHHLTVRGHSNVAYCVAYDKTNSYVITGSDDRLVKIWSTTTGLLLCTCRGHDAELSDLSVNCDNTLFASCSVDSVIRVWKLKNNEIVDQYNDSQSHSGDDQHLGNPVSVLLGHSGQVTAVDFSPNDPHILISTSFDGTCRVWDVRDGAIAPLVLHITGGGNGSGPASLFGASLAATANAYANGGNGARIRLTRHSERRQMTTALNISRVEHQQLHVGAGPSGTGRGTRTRGRAGSSQPASAAPSDNDEEEEEERHHQHGGEDGDDGNNNNDEGVGNEQSSVRLLTCSFSRDGRYIVAGSSDCCVYVWKWPHPDDNTSEGGASLARTPQQPWPIVPPPTRLDGHRNDIWLIQHAKGGTMIASGSMDGTVKVWRAPKRGKKGRGAASWLLLSTLACPVDEEAAALARRRGRQLPPPRVDQIHWTCDDTRLVATMQDSRIHVFSIPDGKLLHSLKAHTEPIHVLMGHPTNPAVTVSASYSGEAVIWDVINGKALKTFESKNTRPGGTRTWPDNIPFIDGFFCSDGSSFALTDAAGQLHIYGFGPPCPFLSRAPYDQFLNTDYEPLIHDSRGNVVSAVTQSPAHIRTGRELLCDAGGSPYPLPFQEAYRQGQLLRVSATDAAWMEEGKQPGYMLAAPTLTAAAWQVYQSGGSATAVDNAIARASARLAEHENNYDAIERSRRTATMRQPPAAPRQQRHTEVVYINEEEDEELEQPSSGEEYNTDEDNQGDTVAGGNRRHQRQRQQQQQQRVSLREGLRRSVRLDAVAHHNRHEDDDEGVNFTNRLRNNRERQRMERQERHARRQAAHEAAMTQLRRRRARQAQRRRNNNDFIVDLGDTTDEEFADLVDEDEVDDLKEENSEEFDEEEGEDEMYNSDDEDDDDSGPSNARNSRKRRRREGNTNRGGSRGSRQYGRARDGELAGSTRRHRSEHHHHHHHHQTTQQPQRHQHRLSRSGAGPRPLTSYFWLTGAEYRPGVYVPQAGDDVIYIREGHAAVLAATSDNRRPPWLTLHRGRTMRAAERCRVIALHYVITQDGTDATAVQVQLELTDPNSPLLGQSFSVDILPPSSGQAEFVILETRYRAAISEFWALGDECVSYWQSGSSVGVDGAGGEWWRGTIIADQRPGGSVGVVNNPYDCGGLWERFEIEWQGPIDAETGEHVASPPSENAAHDPTTPEISLHSPWEMFRWDVVRSTPIPDGTSSLDEATCTRVSAAIETAAAQAAWQIFQAAPEWDEAYRSMSGRLEFYNRRVPLPLGLMDIFGRLACRYYRQREALLHDIRTISDNASRFNGPNNAITADARSLARYLLAVVDETEGETVDVELFLAHGGGGEDGVLASSEDKHEQQREDADDDSDDGSDGGRPASRRRRTGHEGDHDHKDKVHAATRHGRRAASQRVNYREMLEDESNDEDEGKGGEHNNVVTGTGRLSRRQASSRSIQLRAGRPGRLGSLNDVDLGGNVHHYSTRRAQAYEEAAALDAVARAEAGERDAGALRMQRRSTTFRLRRNND